MVEAQVLIERTILTHSSINSYPRTTRRSLPLLSRPSRIAPDSPFLDEMFVLGGCVFIFFFLVWLGGFFAQYAPFCGRWSANLPARIWFDSSSLARGADPFFAMVVLFSLFE